MTEPQGDYTARIMIEAHQTSTLIQLSVVDKERTIIIINVELIQKLNNMLNRKILK